MSRAESVLLTRFCVIDYATYFDELSPSYGLRHSIPRRWISHQEAVSFDLLEQNISPTERKVAGGPRPRAGIVVAALHKKDPDYYFHWVRDSANVMRIMSEYSHATGRELPRLHKHMRDFATLSLDLQKFDLGEPRFTVEDGQINCPGRALS